MKTEVLAIYLPQFHAIPENDKWWGAGFTEWDNVRRGKRYYPGHYQPREPLFDEYYDLSDLKILEKHCNLARKSGIKGFCFYHYYFNGKKLLETPVENYRDKSKEKFPYCLIWANQSWARTWYGSKNGASVLLQQTYGSEADWKKHFYYILPFFKDERYIKIDGKPLYIIYIPQDIKYRKAMFETWRRLAVENGLPGIYLIAMSTGYGADYKKKLYDAYMNFEPMHILREEHSYRKKMNMLKMKFSHYINKEKCTVKNWLFTQNSYSYRYLCRIIRKSAADNNIKTFLGVFPGWDNTARKDEAGMVIGGSAPAIFEKNVEKVLKKSEKMQNEYIFLNAWNEWSEGAYIEPDKRFGYAYLAALCKAIKRNAREKQ